MIVGQRLHIFTIEKKHKALSLIDKYNRKVDYLRIGVTDRCNLRCRYCMPAEGIDFADRSDLLTYEEILKLARVFSNLGISKVRLTGGEPFVRKDINDLLAGLVDIFSDVHVTTNATRLDVRAIAALGISGLNISLDSLDRDKFFLITRRDEADNVLQNIDACIAAQIPVKINVVVMKGVNDREILDFISFGRSRNIPVRFIEAMPFNEGDGSRDVYISAQAILESVMQHHDVHRVVDSRPSAAEHYQIDDYVFDVIPAYSRSLCGTCNRIRLTPQGELLNCLYSQSGTDLRLFLRSGASEHELSQVIRDSVYNKLVDGHAAEAAKTTEVFRSMTTIGG